MTSSEKQRSTHRRAGMIPTIVASVAIGGVGGAGVVLVTDRNVPSTAELRNVSSQEAMLYDEATRTAAQYEAQLRAGKVVMLPYLTGKITDHPEAGGTAKEYGTINNPIFLTPGPDTKDGAAHNGSDLDGGFVGVQSVSADNQIEINVVPFDKDTMDFTPESSGESDFVTAPVATKMLHGSVMGVYAVAEGMGNGQELVIPGFAPDQK